MPESSAAFQRNMSFGAILLALLAVGGACLFHSAETQAQKTATLVSKFYPKSADSTLGLSSVRPNFPETYAQAMRVSLDDATVISKPLNGNPASERTILSNDTIVYSNAFPNCDIAYRLTSGKAEEFLVVHEHADNVSFSWELSHDGNLRPQLSKTGRLELRDISGQTKLCIEAPEGKDAAGTTIRYGERLSYAIVGEETGNFRLTLNADLSGLQFPVVIDPTWTNAGSMSTGRADHTATLLPDGRVLVVGGTGNAGVLSSCEIFDPNANAGAGGFVTAASMTTPRSSHSAALVLNTNNGKYYVIVAGGLDSGGSPLASSEIYDVAGDAWSTSPSMNLNAARYKTSTTVLSNGKVLLAGGLSAPNTPMNTGEVYDPIANKWTASGTLLNARFDHTATLLPDGTVMIAGGDLRTGGLATETDLTEIYSPTNNTFSPGKSLITKRRQHQALLLNTNKVLFIGGYNPGLFPSAEIFTPSTNQNDPTGSMSRPRTEHRYAELSDGKVLVMGCHDGSFANVEYYDPATFTWTITTSALQPHTRHTLTTIKVNSGNQAFDDKWNGKVLLVGGNAGSFIASAELFNAASDPSPQTVTASGPTPLAITLGATSIAASVTFNVATQPAHGTLSGTGANLVYIANAGYVGSDSFTFTASDLFGVSSPATVNINVNSIAPTVVTTTPDAAIAGSSGFTLVIDGSNFVSGAQVKWNGSNRPTTYVSPTRVTADIPASDVSAAGTVSVTVTNPPPGGGTSSVFNFEVLSGTLGVWTVTTTNDSGSGSLRFAMKNARSSDKIVFDDTVFNLLNASAATVINVLSELPAMDKGSVTIDASDRRVTINGTGAGSSCGIVITSASNTVQGLSIVGFTKSGVCITGSSANTNLIGGSRSLPDTNTGPNGQGLRISNCGAFGIQIDSGASDNVVKGCWIGLDASGGTPEPNLAGILIQGGAARNVIGSALGDEANVISGNSFEGITVTGSGTDDNKAIGNILGASAVEVTSREINVGSRDDSFSLQSRSAMGNGNAGMFLSKGTNNTQVGGDNTGEGNVVGYNGGNGVEVRASNSKRNHARKNRISKNQKGGLTLFDGSNNGIQPPEFDEVKTLGVGGRADGLPSRVSIKGHSSTDGTVEIFTDTGTQGGTVAGEATVTGGTFEVEVDVRAGENITATVTDTSGNTSEFAFFGQPPSLAAPIIVSSLSSIGSVNATFSYQIQATGTATITYSATNLPPGLSLSGDTISGTPTAAGTYLVVLSAINGVGSDTKTLVVTITPEGGASTIVTPDGFFNPIDSDADGVSDVLESIAGTGISDANDTPIEFKAVSIDRVAMKLNFAQANKDTASVTMRLTLPTDIALEGTTFGVQFGPLSKPNLKLLSGGKTAKGTTMLSVRRAATGSTSIVATLIVKSETLSVTLAQAGFTNSNISSAKLKLPVAVAIKTDSANYVYDSQTTVTYKSVQNKGGQAKR